MASSAPVHILRSFDALREAFPVLWERKATDIFYTLDWFENLWRFGHRTGAELLLAAVGQGDDVYCLPLCSSVPQAPATSSVTGVSNYYSSLYGPIGEFGSLQGEGLAALFRALRSTKPRPTAVHLRPLDAACAFYPAATEALRQAGYWVDTYHCFGNWYLPVNGRSFDEYLPSLPSALRNTLKRGRKKLDRAGAWAIEIHHLSNVGDASPAAEFTAVYQRSWKKKEPFPDFIPNLCAMAARNGWLRLGILRLDGQPIASQIWLVSGGRALIYKLAYDGAYRDLSAGSVLSAALMQHALDVDKVSEIDYLTGDDRYKRDWMSHRRARRGIIAFDPLTVGGLLAGSRHFAGKVLRSLTGGADPAIAPRSNEKTLICHSA